MAKRILKNTPDFTVNNHGSIVTLNPCSHAAQGWISENIPEDAQRWCSGVVVEPRYIQDIINGIEGDGLTVEVL